jgi:hypothetical protein
MRLFFIGLSSSLLLLNTHLFAQTVSADSARIPNTPLQFLTFAPDARSAGMGEAGVALSADANSAFWNAAKLPYAEKDLGGSVSYTPWLRNLVDDMWLGYASFYKKVGKGQVVGASLNYFNNGELDLRDGYGTQMGYFRSNELALNATYATQLGKNFSMGLTLKYISSNLTGNANFLGTSLKPGRVAAGDISAYYKKQFKNEDTGSDLTWSLGGVISNLGGKISYGTGDPSFIPTMLRVGTGVSFTRDGRNKFNVILDARKLMAPTPRTGINVNTKPMLSGVFGSFSDAPDGFKEELQEVGVSMGAEYLYNDVFALRAGYYADNKHKGGYQFFTAGVGAKFLKNYGVDFAYLFPVTQNSPLAQTLRISLSVYLAKKEKLDLGDEN